MNENPVLHASVAMTGEGLYETFVEELAKQSIWPDIWDDLSRGEMLSWNGLARRIQKGKIVDAEAKMERLLNRNKK
jgi:hypothetical protein